MQGPLAAGALESDRLGLGARRGHHRRRHLSLWASGRQGVAPSVLAWGAGSGVAVQQAPGSGRARADGTATHAWPSCPQVRVARTTGRASAAVATRTTTSRTEAVAGRPPAHALSGS